MNANTTLQESKFDQRYGFDDEEPIENREGE